jgi:SAM-dependent methyltransferase
MNNYNINDVKTFWNNRPCNIRHSQKELNTKEYFEEVSCKRYTVEPHISEFADFSKYKNLKVLEVGCGIGTDAQKFAEHGAIYHGIDLTENSIEISKKRFDLFNLSGNFEVQNIETYVSGNTYDLIYSFGVLHHTPDIESAIKNIYNLLNDNGEFKLMLYAKNSLKYFSIKDGLDQYEAQSNVPIANVYERCDVYKLLHNFKDIEIVQTHIFPYKINEYKHGELVKEDYFNVMPDELFNCLKKNLGWHLCITCKK